MSYSAREHYRPAQSNNQQYPSSEEERLTGTFTSFKSNKRERDRMAAAIQLQGNHRAPSPPLHGQETSPNKRTTAFIRRDREVSTTSKNYTYSRYTQSRQSSNLKSERRFSAMSENRPNDLSLCNRFEYSVSSKKRHPTAEEGTFKYSDRRITDEQQKFELNDLNDYSGFSGNFGYVGQLDTFRERDERFQTASRGQDTAGKTANSGGYGGLERFTFQKRDRRKDLMMISEHVGEDEMQENHPMNFQDYSHSHKKRENRDIYGSGGRRTNLDLSGSKFKGSNIREYSNTDRYSLRSSGKKFELKPEKLNFRKKIEREETRRLPPNGNRGYSPSGSSLEKPRYALKALRKSRSDFTQSPPLSSIKETLNRSKESFGKPNRGYGLEQSEYTYRSGGPGFGSRDNSWTTICPSKEGTEEAYSFKDRPYVPRSQRDFSKASRPTITTAYENDDSEIKIGYADDSYSLLRDDGSKFDDESKFRYSRLRTGDKFGYGYVEDDPRLQDPYARLAEARNYGYDPRKGEKRKFSGENLSHLNRRKSAISFNTSDRRSQNEISESKYGPYSSRKSSFRQKRRYPEYDQNSSSREFSSKENGSSDYTYHYHGDYNAWDDSSYQNDCYGDTSTSIPRNRILSSESKDYETPPLYQHHRPHRRRSKSPRRPQIDFEQPHQMYQYSDHTAENIITDELKRYSSGCFVSPTKLLESSSTRERKVLEIASNNSAYNGRYGRKITHNYNSKEFTEDGGSRISGLVESRDYGIVAKGVVAGSGSTPTTERVLACKENFGSTGDLRFVNLNGYTSTNNKNSSVSGVRYGYESNGHGAPGVPENRGRRSLGPVVGGASGSKLNEGVSSGGEGARRSFVSDKENKGGLYNNKEDEEKSRNFIKKKNRIGEVRGNRGGRRLHKDSDEHPEHSPEKYNTQPKSNTQPSQNQVKKRAEFERERLKNNKNKKEQLKSSKYLINGNLRAAYQSAEPASHAASRNLNSTTPNRFQYSSQLIDQNDLKIDIKTSDSSTGFRPPLAPESDRIAKHDPRPSFLKAKGGSRNMSESMHVLETDNLFPEPRNSAHNTKTVRNSYGNSNSDINNRPTRNPSLDSCLLQKEAKEAKSRSVKDGGTQSLQFGTGYAEIGGSITSTVRQISGRTKHAVSMEMASRSNFKSCYGFLKRVMVVIKDSEGCLPLRLELLDWRSKRVLYRSVFKGGKKNTQKPNKIQVIQPPENPKFSLLKKMKKYQFFPIFKFFRFSLIF